MPPTTTMSFLRPKCSPLPTTTTCTQIRHASLLRRPKRPYTFTQMITLSDGSTYLHRTTSPMAIYRSTKDTKNNPLWNPSSQKLANVEEDEAGRLKRFRGRFGRGWDAEVVTQGEEVSAFLSWKGEFSVEWTCSLTGVWFVGTGRRRSARSVASGRQFAGFDFGLWTRCGEEGRGGRCCRAEEEEWKGQGW
jgi:hypothetical protein